MFYIGVSGTWEEEKSKNYPCHSGNEIRLVILLPHNYYNHGTMIANNIHYVVGVIMMDNTNKKYIQKYRIPKFKHLVAPCTSIIFGRTLFGNTEILFS